MFEHNTEIQQLTSHLNQLEKGQGALMMVEGIEGMGKSTLLKKASEMARERKLSSVYLSLTPVHQSSFYHSLKEILAVALEVEPGPMFGLLSCVESALIRMFPKSHGEFAPILTLYGAQEEHSLLLGLSSRERDGMISYLSLKIFSRLFVLKPRLLALDNIHRADEKSLEVIMALSRLIIKQSPAGFLLLSTDGEIVFPEDFNPEVVSLGGLSTKVTHDVMAAQLEVAPDQLDSMTSEIVNGKAQGNPLFIEHLTRLLEEKGYIQRQDGRVEMSDSSASLRLPNYLQGVLVVRLDLLSKDDLEILKYASCLGPNFESPVLKSYFRDRERVDNALDSLSKRGMVVHVEEDLFRFSHRSLRNAVYNSILRRRRSQLHEDLAEILEEKSFPPEIILRHYLEGENREKKLYYLGKVAESRDLAGLYEEASYFYHLALELLEEGSQPWRENKRHATQALVRHEQVNIAIGHLVELLDYCDDEERPWIYMILAKMHEKKEEYGAALQYCRQALAVGRADLEIELNTRCLWGSCLIQLRDLVGAEDVLVEALEKTHEDNALKANILYFLGEIYRRRNTCETAISCYIQAAEIFQRFNKLSRYYQTLHNMGLLYLKTEMFQESRDAFRSNVDFLKKVGDQVKLGEAYYYLGTVLLKKGEHRFALTMFRRSIALLEQNGESLLLGMAYLRSAELELKFSHFQEGEKLALAAVEFFGQVEDLPALSEAQDLLNQVSQAKKESQP